MLLWKMKIIVKVLSQKLVTLNQQAVGIMRKKDAVQSD